jgi:hypothetical protein
MCICTGYTRRLLKKNKREREREVKVSKCVSCRQAGVHECVKEGKRGYIRGSASFWPDRSPPL